MAAREWDDEPDGWWDAGPCDDEEDWTPDISHPTPVQPPPDTPPASQPTQDFIGWYQAWCREGTSPSVYQRWVGLSLLSAAVQNRVKVARDAIRVGNLSLFLLLLGDSGIGKGEAMVEQAVELVGHDNPDINAFIGRFTSPALLDYLSGSYGKGKKATWKPRNWSHAWLVVEELASGLHTGDLARTALNDLTALWGRSQHHDMTRGNKLTRIKDISLSVVAGTTETWLRDVFHSSTADSGTLARFLAVDVEPNFQQVKHPPTPPNWQELNQWMRAWIHAFLQVGIGGPPIVLEWDEEAIQEKADAVMMLAKSHPELYFRPYLNRTDEMVSKLAGLFTISGWPLVYTHQYGFPFGLIDVPASPIIRRAAVRRAVVHYLEAFQSIPRLIRIVRSTPWSRETDIIQALIESEGGRAIAKSKLIRQAKNVYGLTAINTENALQALIESEEVFGGTYGKDGQLYPMEPYNKKLRGVLFWPRSA